MDLFCRGTWQKIMKTQTSCSGSLQLMRRLPQCWVYLRMVMLHMKDREIQHFPHGDLSKQRMWQCIGVELAFRVTLDALSQYPHVIVQRSKQLVPVTSRLGQKTCC